jgi:orotate phosphoribosyltransferase
MLDAFWRYDYEAAAAGRVGMHAMLKSGKHSDGFFISSILLGPDNIRTIFTQQMAMRLIGRLSECDIEPDYVTGVPDGASRLGEDICQILCAQSLRMSKVDGRITFDGQIEPGASILIVEDVCTTGTGYVEAVNVIRQAQPNARIILYDPVLINRGGLTTFQIDGVGTIEVLPVADIRIQDWDAANCPLCAMRSTPIKPKATGINWEKLISSQQ